MHARRSNVSLRLLTCAWFVACAAWPLAGCRPQGQEQRVEINPVSAEPAELLAGMLAAYAQAETYSDRAEIIFRHNSGGQSNEDITGLAITYARPRQVRVELTFDDAEILMADDGEMLRARIVAEESENFDNQFVSRAAPAELHCGSLYEATTLVVPGSDAGSPPVSVLTGPYVRLEQLPLGLLLGDSQLPAIIADAKNVTELRGRDFEGHACRRIRIEAPEGEFTFWIDRENLTLRRIEYPAKAILEGQAAAGMVRDASLVVELHDAQLNGPLAEDAFQLAQPAEARVVTRFVQPLFDAPPPQLGRQAGNFTLVNLRGEPVSSASWQGKRVALFIFDNHPDCGVAASHVEAVYRYLREEGELEKAIVWGVCAEAPESFSNAQLESLAAQWQMSFPLVRDLTAASLDVLEVTEAPAVVVLDGTGRVQYFQAGATPALSEELAVVFERLGKGEDLAREHLDYYAEQSEAYRQALIAMQPGGEEEIIELPDPDQPLPERDEPRRLALEQAWSNADLGAPGNIIVVPGAAGEDDTVYLLDGWRTVVELNAEGSAARRIELDLPEQAAISFLRQAVDGQGRVWFAGSSRLAPQAFLFDDQWQTVLSYPDAETEHPGVQDVLPADLDGADDGPLRLYVAFWESAGVHAVDLQGNREWLNRSVQPALSLTASPPGAVGWQNLLVTSDSGAIVPINRFGNAEASTRPGRDGVHGLFSGREWLAEGATLVGVAFEADGGQVLKGLGADLGELWRYTLPAGLAAGVRPVASGTLVEGVPMQWVIASGNGSLHLISSDAELVDWFHYGSRIDGIGIARLGGEPLLLVASEGAVTAWRVKLKGE